MGATPGHIRGEIAIDVASPRDRNSMHFKALVDSKELFRRQVLERAPLVATIHHTLLERLWALISFSTFSTNIILMKKLNISLRRQPIGAADAELFEYDAQERRLTITSED